MVRHFLSLLDLTKEELLALMARTGQLKQEQRQGKVYCPLIGKSIGLIFIKHSTRTRVSFMVGIYQLGAQAVNLDWDQMQVNRGESIKDTARVLSRYLDGIVYRGSAQEEIEELARWSNVPVINALTDLYHPCQVLSDLFTIKEAGIELEKMKLVFIGDPNNVFNSWVNASALLGFELKLACPSGYELNQSVVKRAEERGGVKLKIYNDPYKAVQSADIIYTDVWVSMGQEKDAKKRRKDFQGFQLNRRLVEETGKRTLILHCLPAHRGEEITEEVLENYAELILEQAENRLHSQKAILELLILGLPK